MKKSEKIKCLIKRHAIQSIASLALIITVASVNATCLGPGYQPEMPESAAKFKREYK